MEDSHTENTSAAWWLILFRGIILLLFGVFLITVPGLVLSSLVLFFGLYWFAHGVFSLIGLFAKRASAHRGLLLLDAVIGILAGIFVLSHPLFTAFLIPTAIVAILAILGISMGSINLFQGIKGGGAGITILGIINIFFGVFLLLHPALVAMFASFLPITAGILGIIGGIALVVNALSVRAAARGQQP